MKKIKNYLKMSTDVNDLGVMIREDYYKDSRIILQKYYNNLGVMMREDYYKNDQIILQKYYDLNKLVAIESLTSIKFYHDDELIEEYYF
jgi:hypothetical protein